MENRLAGFPERAIITEVGSRDGLQSEPVFVPRRCDEPVTTAPARPLRTPDPWAKLAFP